MSTEVLTTLDDAHYKHLAKEGFSHEEILELEGYGARSISKSEAVKLGLKKWDGTRHVSGGGLYFPFHSDYGQVRFNEPLKTSDGEFKYLGPSKPPKVWYPQSEIMAITEGWKDAAIATVRGCPTGAIVGVDNIIHCVPQWSEIPIIFDSDGWRKPQVVRALIWGALWTNGKINLFPAMPDHPTGGACEWFKSGGGLSEYQALIDNAMTPHEFLQEWIAHWDAFDSSLKICCAQVATDLCFALQNADSFIEHLEQKVRVKQAEWTSKK